jgi:hypothetical protein
MGAMARVLARRPPRPDGSPNPDDRGRGPQPHEATRRMMTRVATYYGYDASGSLETTTKTMTDIALHRMVDKPPMCLQCLPRPAQ